jgi:hypothetical protein
MKIGGANPTIKFAPKRTLDAFDSNRHRERDVIYAAAIVYACSTGWCVNVLGTVEAPTADACVQRLWKETVMISSSGYPTCFVPNNGMEATLLPPFLDSLPPHP